MTATWERFTTKSMLLAPLVFSFHLLSEVHTLDPAHVRGVSGAYLFHNTYRGLYRYTTREGLQPEGAESCEFKTPKRIVCRLRANHRWSDGRAVRAEDYVAGWRRLADPKTMTSLSELILPVRHARAIMDGRRPPTDLGVRAIEERRIEITLERPFPDFLFHLAQPVMSPIRQFPFPARERAVDILVTGPYRFTNFLAGRRIELEPNPHYPSPVPLQQRPRVTALVVEDDQTARRMYDTGQLTFLRRVIVQDIARSQTSPEFFQVPMARFDYLGFGPELTADPAAREALTLALDYAELKKLLASRGELGCPSLPESYLASRPCYRMDLSRARALWEKVDPTLRARRLTLGFSSQGGEDIRTQAQWFQNQWKKHLHLNVELTSLDDAMHVARLRQAPPAFFRRGVSLDRPTCLAALETFRADSPENFLRINDTAFENLLGSLVSAVDGSAKKTACSKAIEHLMNRHLFIPLGEMHFSMMMKPQWEGFEVNELNQLDLSRLRRKTDASGKNKDTL